MGRDGHIVFLSVVTLMFLGYVALAIEDNSSSLVPPDRLNREFVRVLTDIVDSNAVQGSRNAARNPTDAPDAQHVDSGQDGEMDDGERELQNMRETSGLMYDDMRKAQGGALSQDAQRLAAKRRRAAARKDSFYFLQHTMRRRSLEKRAAYADM